MNKKIDVSFENKGIHSAYVVRFLDEVPCVEIVVNDGDSILIEKKELLKLLEAINDNI